MLKKKRKIDMQYITAMVTFTLQTLISKLFRLRGCDALAVNKEEEEEKEYKRVQGKNRQQQSYWT